MARASNAPKPPPLVDELCRVFHAHPTMINCVILHGQLTIDGWIIRVRHVNRWPPEKLRGRMAGIPGRSARLEFPRSLRRGGWPRVS